MTYILKGQRTHYPELQEIFTQCTGTPPKHLITKYIKVLKALSQLRQYLPTNIKCGRQVQIFDLALGVSPHTAILHVNSSASECRNLACWERPPWAHYIIITIKLLLLPMEHKCIHEAIGLRVCRVLHLIGSSLGSKPNKSSPNSHTQSYCLTGVCVVCITHSV